MRRLEHILWSILCGAAVILPGCYASDDRSAPEPPADISTDDDADDVDTADPPLPEGPVVGMYGVPGP